MISLRAASVVVLLTITACGDAAKSIIPDPPPNPGTMRVAISGAVAHQSTWNAYGELRDVLASTTGDLSLLAGQSPDTAIDLEMTVVVPSRLDVGTLTVGRYTVGELPATPAAFVILDTAFFASIPGGELIIADADYPPRPGLEPGLMSGRMTFRAVRIAQNSGGPPVETHDTITVHATFAATWSHFLRPNVSVTLTGGPLEGTSLASTGQSTDDDHGGRFVSWSLDFDLAPGQGLRYEVNEEFRLAAPAVGVFTLAAVTPPQYATPAQWPAAFASVFYRDDPRIALSTGGTLTITKFLAPTDAYYGEIQGTLDAPLALWSDNTTVTADTVHVAATFAVQLYPLGGIPASSPIRREGHSNP